MVNITLRELANQRLSLQMPDLKSSTYQKYRQIYSRYILPEFGDMMPDDITTGMIESFRHKLFYEYGLSNKSVKDILIILNSLFKYVTLLYPEYKSPNIIFPKEQKKDMRVMTDMEIKEFTTHLISNMTPCSFGILLSLYSGLRIGEIAALKWSNIDLQNGTISIENTLQRITDSDSSSERKTKVTIGSPKTASSIRLIPIHSDISDMVELMQSDRENYVLTGTTHFMEPRALQYRLKKYLKNCNIEGVHFHTLRHTFATKCVEAGVEIKVLSEILGHSKTSVTFDRYVHTTMEFKRKNINKISFL